MERSQQLKDPSKVLEASTGLGVFLSVSPILKSALLHESGRFGDLWPLAIPLISVANFWSAREQFACAREEVSRERRRSRIINGLIKGAGGILSFATCCIGLMPDQNPIQRGTAGLVITGASLLVASRYEPKERLSTTTTQHKLS